MLEKEDLQAIRAIMKEEIDASEQRMTQRMDQQRKDIMSDVKEEISASEQRMTQHTETLIAQSEQRMTQRTETLIAQSEQRVTQHTETLIAQSEQRMDQKLERTRKDIMHDVDVLMDAKFTPQFNLLAEGQQTILETLAPKSRVEALEDEMLFLKQIVKGLAQDVQELKKAQ